jgi:hypothetical protein
MYVSFYPFNPIGYYWYNLIYSILVHKDYVKIPVKLQIVNADGSGEGGAHV